MGRSWRPTGVEWGMLLISTVFTVLAILYVRVTFDGFARGRYMLSANDVMSPILVLVPTLWWAGTASEMTQHRVPRWLFLAVVGPLALWLALRA